MDPKATRGYRNRNPGNIDYRPQNKWQGQVGLGDDWMPATQRRFAAFQTHEFGIRALAVLLTTYQDRHGLRSIGQIINRWAPGNENNTGAYIQHVAKLTGIEPNAVLDLHDFHTMRALVTAIITHELGGQPYTADVIDGGLRLAGLVPTTVREVAASSTTVQAAASTGAAGALALALPGMLDAVAEAVPALEPLAHQAPWLGTALVVLTALANVWRRLRRV